MKSDFLCWCIPGLPEPVLKQVILKETVWEHLLQKAWFLQGKPGFRFSARTNP